jgi:transcriptional regulator with XRE-family HTH domain
LTDDDSDGRFARALGVRVRAARDAARMTQGGIEREAGLHAGSMSPVERGEIAGTHVADLAAVAAAVGVEPAALVPPADGDPATAGAAR